MVRWQQKEEGYGQGTVSWPPKAIWIALLLRIGFLAKDRLHNLFVGHCAEGISGRLGDHCKDEGRHTESDGVTNMQRVHDKRSEATVTQSGRAGAR